MQAFDSPTLYEVENALNFLDPNVARDEWAKVAMALKNEFGDLALDAFDRWSQGGESYNPAACRSTWRSVRAFGGGSTITIKHIFRLAIDAGFTPDKKELSADEKAKRAQELEQRKVDRIEREKAEALHVKRWHAVIEKCANEIWNLCATEGKCDYLERKQVRGFGVRFVLNSLAVEFFEHEYRYEFSRGQNEIAAFWERKKQSKVTGEHFSGIGIKAGSLIVPLCVPDYSIKNLQVIFAAGAKVFLPGPKSDLFHFFGNIVKSDEPLIIAEGYASAASCHMATGWDAVVAFDAGNLVKVARQMRDFFPERRIVICGDDDHETAGNPGKAAAINAANACGGTVIFPQFIAEQSNAA